MRGKIDPLRAESARCRSGEIGFSTADRSARLTRFFDYGSAKSFGKTPFTLAFARDDGMLKAQLPLIW
jgi:hypothetical protein